MRYLLRTNISYEDLSTKIERAVLTRVGRDGSEMAVYGVFCSLVLFSEQEYPLRAR